MPTPTPTTAAFPLFDSSGNIVPGYAGLGTAPVQSNGLGHNFLWLGRAGQLRFRAVGSACSVTVYVQDNNPVSLTIDGVTTTPTLSYANAFFTWTLFTGLADAPHDVVIADTNGNAHETGFDVAGFSVTGSAPAVTSSPGFAGHLALYGPVSPAIQVAADMATNPFGYAGQYSTGMANQFAPAGGVEFVATGPGLTAWVQGESGQKYAAETFNGSSWTLGTEVATAGGATFQLVNLAIPTGTARTRVVCTAGTTGTIADLFGTFSTATLHPASRRVACLGDSITEENGWTTNPTTSSLGWVRGVARISNCLTSNISKSGTAISRSYGFPVMSALVDVLVACPFVHDEAVVFLGTNDANAPPSGGDLTLITSTVTTQVNRILAAGIPKVTWVFSYVRSTVTLAVQQSVNNAIISGLAQVTNTTAVRYLDGYNLLALTDLQDGTHPSIGAAEIKLGVNMAALLYPVPAPTPQPVGSPPPAATATTYTVWNASVGGRWRQDITTTNAVAAAAAFALIQAAHQTGIVVTATRVITNSTP